MVSAQPWCVLILACVIVLHMLPVYPGFLSFWQFVIVYQVMVPIALYITLEAIKLGQAYFIVRDYSLYDRDTNTAMICRALNIFEDLGQVCACESRLWPSLRSVGPATCIAALCTSPVWWCPSAYTGKPHILR